MKLKSAVFGILFVMLIGSVYAYEFDNVKSYDSTTRTVTITNAFGLGSKIADIQLITPNVVWIDRNKINQCVGGVGKDCLITEIKINSYEDYKSALESIDFYNKASMNKINRIFIYKYKVVTGTQDVNDYDYVCSDVGNKSTMCENKVIGSHKENVYGWSDYSKIDVNKGEIIIGIFTDVNKGDNVEWQPIMFGVKIDEWASFIEASLMEFQDNVEPTAPRAVGSYVWNGVGYNPVWRSQTFMVGGNGTAENFDLKGFSIPVCQYNETGVISVCLYSAAGIYPVTKLVCNNSINMSKMNVGPNNYSWYNISMPSYTLLNHYNYSIVINSSSSGTGGDTQVMDWGAYNVLLYKWGNLTYSTDLGSTWIYGTEKQALFQVWGNSSTALITLIINSKIYNATSYETFTESFILNLTYNNVGYTSIGVNLSYNGIEYPAARTGTGGEAKYTKTFSMDTLGTIPLFWNITLSNATGKYYDSTTPVNQVVKAINFSICAEDNNATYINYTFRDENSLSLVEMNITSLAFSYGMGTPTKYFSYSNLTGSSNYKFCFSPPFKNITLNGTFAYSSPTYPQRIYPESGTFSNSTTERTLYGLSSSDGIYATFQVLSDFGQQVTGANVLVEYFNAGWINVGTATTDSAGLVIFWLNHLVSYRITTSKAGYIPTVITITPSQNIYSIILVSSSISSNYTYNLKGITYYRNPPSGLLAVGEQVFEFNVSAQLGNIYNCSFELINSTGDIVNFTTGFGTYYCSASLIQDFTQDLVGRYYLDFGDGSVMIESDGKWYTIPLNESAANHNTIKDLLNFLSNAANWGSSDITSDEYKKYEFTKIVAFFLILAIISAAANVGFKFDVMNPGYFLLGLPFIIWIVSIPAGFHGQGLLYIHGATPWGVLDNLVIPLYTTLIAAGFWFEYLRRQG